MASMGGVLNLRPPAEPDTRPEPATRPEPEDGLFLGSLVVSDPHFEKRRLGSGASVVVHVVGLAALILALPAVLAAPRPCGASLPAGGRDPSCARPYCLLRFASIAFGPSPTTSAQAGHIRVPSKPMWKMELTICRQTPQ